ncbi:hypothetical protein HMSSN139_15110 [Paenibacillus sp. HMSSN-139]|nr:hypothetical protein HMSSN139_15110 [Paenibacillus sp. HMSSN-139]
MFALLAKRKDGFFKLFAALCIASLLPLYPLGPLPTVSAASLVTIDAPANGDEVEVGTLTVSGQYMEAYNIVLIVNGTDQLPTRTDSENGEASGVWSAELDTSRYDGEITLLARGTQSTTRYGVSSQPITIRVDNPQVTKPAVSITNPLMGLSSEGNPPRFTFP